jgi:hypothetical protein
MNGRKKAQKAHKGRAINPDPGIASLAASVLCSPSSFASLLCAFCAFLRLFTLEARSES